MVQVNVHSYSPRWIGGYLCLLLSYIPPVIAFGLMLLVMVPYYRLYCIDTLWHGLVAHHRQATDTPQSQVPGNISSGAQNTSVIWFLFCVVFSGYFFGSLLVAFWKCIFTSPGYVSHDPWSEEPHVDGHTSATTLHSRTAEHSVTQLTRAGRARYCSSCSLYKPDDAHHCHDCGRCVDRMDHHCPWINNCVGLETEKYFILFLLYISLTGSFVATTLGLALKSGGISVFNTIFLIMDLIGAAVFGVAMLGFVVFHLTMLYKGMTTIDYVIAKRTGVALANANAAKRQQVLTSVFGTDRRWWVMLLPIAPKRACKDHDGDDSAMGEEFTDRGPMITVRVGRPDAVGPTRTHIVEVADDDFGGPLDLTTTTAAVMDKSYNGATGVQHGGDSSLSASVRHLLTDDDSEDTGGAPIRIKYFHTTL